ncbi:MAG: SPFH domain-containing protein [Anaerolineae bacterium]|nr:SPFH domain-containing protein [Anaerolineae bacterium]
MNPFKHFWKHLVPVLLTFGPIVLILVLLGLVLTSWEVDPLPHLLNAAIAVLPLVLALILLPYSAARFLRDLYDIESLADAYAFLSRLVFRPWSFNYLKIEDTRVVLGEDSVLHRVGGPGNLIIYNDSAVVTERFGKLCRVLGPGFPALQRFEKVWDIVDLRYQYWPFQVDGMTREGIPVSCLAKIKFKIDDRETEQSPPKSPTDANPYPFTEEAVFCAATSSWIRPPDWEKWPHDWAGRVVVSYTEGVLRNILAEYRLDELVAPVEAGSPHPREEICRRLEEALRKRERNVGARILSVELGEMQFEDEQIPLQWVEAWKAEWEEHAVRARAEGEAQLLSVDAVQAAVQAEMITAVVAALQSLDTSVESRALVARLAQMFHWMSYNPLSRTHLPPEVMHTLGVIQENLLGE